MRRELLIKWDYDSKSVVTPGIKGNVEGEEGERKLEGRNASQYRALVARGNYLAQDRSGVQLPVEICAEECPSQETGTWDH